MVHPVGFEPTHLAAPEPESGVYANFTTGASGGKYIKNGFAMSTAVRLEIFRSLSHSTVLIFKHRGLGWGRAGRFASRLEATYSPLSIAADTVRQWWLEVAAHNFGRPTVLRFARFRVMCISLTPIVLETWSRNGADRKSMAIFPFQPLAVALLHYLLQSTKRAWPLYLSP